MPAPFAERNAFPLTSLQKSMVLSSMRSPRSGTYVIQDVCELSEDLDVPLVRSAWRRIALRHPALRTGIAGASAEPFLQDCHADADVPWQELNWVDLPPDVRSAKLDALLREDRERGFRFDGSVPMRFTLIRTGPQSYTLIWTLHHAALDGRSLQIVWKEWFALYDASRCGRDIDPCPASPYRDYVAWQLTHDLAEAGKFWRAYLAGLSQTTDFVIERTKPAAADGVSKKGVLLSAGLTAQLLSFAVRHEITLNSLVQGAWALLLSHYSGRADVVMGATRACRHCPALETSGMVGLLINTLPFRIAVNGDVPLVGWLKSIRQDWVALREHEHTPLERVSEWSGLPPGAPLFDNVLVYENEPPGESLNKLGGQWEHRSLRRLQRTDSSLTVAAYGGRQLSLEIVFDTRLFRAETITRMLGHLETLLHSFLAQPDAPLAAIKMLTQEEEARLLHEWNHTMAPYPRDLCAHQLFEQQVRRTPASSALEHAGASISYAELNARSNRLAWYLRRRGARPEDLVAICLDRSPEAVVAILSVLKAGAAFLPLFPALPRERLQLMLETSRPRFVLSQNVDLPDPALYGGQVLDMDRLRADIARQPAEDLPNIAAPQNAAYAIFTSGSTGRPKAVVVPHRVLVNHTWAAARAFEISPADRRLQFASMGTDVIVAEIFNYLCHGATLVFALHRSGNSIQEYLRILTERRITITGIPSSWWNEWVVALPAERMEPPPHLRAVITGMERVNPAAFLAWRRIVGNRVRWFNAYGPTETGPTATVYEAGSSPWESASFVPIGKPIANTTAYVLDTDGNPVPVGVCGELYLGGEGVARGYLNSPELTARSFLADPFNPGPENHLYKTGDLAFYVSDGNLVFLGRADRQVKVRGFRVELDEVEITLARHPAVRQCAVRMDDSAGSPRLMAYVTWRSGEYSTADQLRQHLARYLPEHMLPAAFVPLPELPRAPGGKIDYLSLPPSEPREIFRATGLREPATTAEKLMAELWQKALGVPQVGADDNFFALGGDSLRASHLITLIHERFGREVPLSTLLRAPTLARLSAVLESAADAAADSVPLIPLQPRGSLPPLFCISSTPVDAYRLHDLAVHLGDDQPFYALPNPIGEGESINDVHHVAARAVRSIREHTPHGPYVLGGYCFGGIVAVETARQLVSMGEEVSLVVLLDAPTPGYPRALRRVAPYWRGLRRRFLGAGGFAIPAGGQYIPRPFAVPVVQFNSRDEGMATRILRAFVDSRRGWRDVCSGEFQVLAAAGSHVTMLLSPHVAETAVALRQSLERVRSRSRP